MLDAVGELDSYDMEFVDRRRMELSRAEQDAGGKSAAAGSE